MTDPIHDAAATPDHDTRHGERALLSRRNMLLGLGLGAVSGLAVLRQPKPANPRLADDYFEKIIPKTIGPWQFETASGLILPPEDDLVDALYNETLTRVYRGSGDLPAVMFLIAYSSQQTGLLQLHRPEFCYPASGFKLSDTVVQPVKVAGREYPMRMFGAEAISRNEQILYWTRVGNHFPVSWTQQRGAVIADNIRGDIPDGILVRVSTTLADMTEAKPYLEKFVNQLFASSNTQVRKLLFAA